MFENCKMYIDGQEIDNVNINNLEVGYSSEYVYDRNEIPLLCFDKCKSTVEFNASFNTQLVEHLLQPTRDSNKFDVTFKIPVQVRKHKKKRINKKWLKKYGVTMVEYTVKNARLEHNYITNT